MKKTQTSLTTESRFSALAKNVDQLLCQQPAMTEKERDNAISKLINANLLQSLKRAKQISNAQDVDADDNAQNDDQIQKLLRAPTFGQSTEVKEASKLQLRFSISPTMNLVDRLTELPPIQTSQRSLNQSNKKSDRYELTCEKDLGILHELDNPIAVLNDYPFHSQEARFDFPLFVLWAMHSVKPELYQKLIGTQFGPAQEPARQLLKVLPEPVPYDESEPPFEFKYGQVFGRHSIHPTELVHTFITGATGAGKTYGGVKPLLQSFLSYKNKANKSMGMLVIDPKSELLNVCTDELSYAVESNRMFRPGAGQKISLFTTSCELGLEDRYRTLSRQIQIKVSGDSSIWQEKGNRLNIDMAMLDRRFQLQTGYLLWGVVRSLMDGNDCTQRSQWENILAVYKHSLQSRGNIEWLTAVSHVLMGLCPGMRGLKSVFASYLSDPELQNQLFYRVSNAEQICVGLSAPEVVGVINTDLFPDQNNNDVSIEDLIDEGRVILYQPTPTHFGDITARLVKSRFFTDALERCDMRQPVGYVADEFQRFITSDRDSGELSFLDRCRAYRVNCVLASQSLSSIEHALIQTGESSPKLAVEIITANSPTKIVYRSMDANTHRTLKDWIPPAPEGRQHVVDIRPVAQLVTGSAYYLCNGGWGMYRYEKAI